jgi:outer membrane protein assembly factor BamB
MRHRTGYSGCASAAAVCCLVMCSAIPQPLGIPSAGADSGVLPGGNDNAPAWPMFRNGWTRAGQSSSDTTCNRGELLWKCKLGSIIYSSPVIGADGTAYVGCSDHYLSAVRPNGTLAWNLLTGSDILSSPAIAPDGTIYIGSDRLYAVSPHGRVKWSFPTTYPMSSSPAVAPDGKIYFGTMQGTLFCLMPDGRTVGFFNASRQIPSSPALDGEGNIYFGSYDGCIYSITPEMSLRWSFKTGDYVGATPAIGPDGTVYVGSKDGLLYAIDSAGALKWSYDLRHPVFSSVAIGPGGMLYLGCYDKVLYAFNQTGALKWTYATEGWVDSSPSVGADGTIYVGSGDSRFYAIRPNGTLSWSLQTGSSIFSSPAISANGSVMFGSWDRHLYCVGSFFRKPSPPQNLSAVVVDRNVELHWEPPASDGGKPVAAYRIWRGAKSPEGTALCVLQGDVLMFTDFDVRQWGTYFYHVTALNEIGESNPGNEVSLTVLFRPTPPRKLRAVGGTASILLNWTPPEDTGGSPLESYCIYCSAAKGYGYLIATVDLQNCSYLHDGLDEMVYYSYEVTAVNGIGESARSNTAEAMLAPPPAEFTDDQPPWIQILEPLDGAVYHLDRVVVSGQAQDDRGVARVELSRDGRGWSGAGGNSSWSGELALSPGQNTIYARAADRQNNTATVHITVRYDPPGSGVAAINFTLVTAMLVVAMALAYGLAALRKLRSSPR